MFDAGNRDDSVPEEFLEYFIRERAKAEKAIVWAYEHAEEEFTLFGYKASLVLHWDAPEEDKESYIDMLKTNSSND